MSFNKAMGELRQINAGLDRILRTAKRERDEMERLDRMTPYLVPFGFAFAVAVLVAVLCATQ